MATSKKSYKESRMLVLGNYNGYDIIKVRIENYHRNFYGTGYDTSWIEKVEHRYEFCKAGESSRPSQAYNNYARSIEECKGQIDKFIKDDTLYFTGEELRKYVTNPNVACKLAYGHDSLMRVMREHQKADKRMKRLIEERLTDANFHSECGYLINEDYDGFIKFVTENWKFREKFEILTETESKRIKNPKQFEEGLAKVVEDYLASQGVKGTTAKVKFIEEW